MNFISITVPKVFITMGNIMRPIIVKLEAPSSLAASSTSFGILRKTLKNTRKYKLKKLHFIAHMPSMLS